MFSDSFNYEKWIGQKAFEWKFNLLMVGAMQEPETEELITLIDKYIPEGEPHIVFDVTCHLMDELKGNGKTRLFDKATLRLTQEAFLLTKKELNVADAMQLSETQQDNFGGVAFFNLLLPKEQGGIYSDEDYPKFLTELCDKLNIYKTATITNITSTNITPDLLNTYLQKFKEFATQYFQSSEKLIPSQSSSSTNTPKNS